MTVTELIFSTAADFYPAASLKSGILVGILQEFCLDFAVLIDCFRM